jgi:indole-3-glycerol phosphate synthase
MKAEPQDSGVLERILAQTTERVAARAAELDLWERRARSAREPADFAAALRGATAGGRRAVAVIAEVKRRSPSAGMIRPGADAADLARRYVAGGATAVSVLTEPSHFAGSAEDLSRVSEAVAVPVLRKDFIIHPVQVFEARALGAAAVLLIARALTAASLRELAALSRGLGLASLVEVHTAAELDEALKVAPAAVGINARDLETLRVDQTVAERLLPLVPAGLPAVTESGIAGRSDVERLALWGADAVLVGSALSGAPDPESAVRSLVGVGRVGRGGDP